MYSFECQKNSLKFSNAFKIVFPFSQQQVWEMRKCGPMLLPRMLSIQALEWACSVPTLLTSVVTTAL